MKKKCQVVLLHTTTRNAALGTFDTIYNDNGIDKHREIIRQFVNPISVEEIMKVSYKPANLYILSDNEIKEDDWIYFDGIGFANSTDYPKGIYQVESSYKKGLAVKQNEFTDFGFTFVKKEGGNHYVKIGYNIPRTCKKIIATTDSSLKWTDDNDIQIIDYHFAQLPQPSPKFISEYITAYNTGNPITEVFVEYEEFHFMEEASGYIQKLKVDNSNQITITKLKDNWSREEVIELIYKFNGEFGNGYIQADNWISQNL